MRRTIIFAHRGASAYRTENTMPAFKLAVEQKADGIELDVQMTRDGILVVQHDETVDRVWQGSGAVKDFTYAQLRALRAKDSQDTDVYMPTLHEVLDYCSPLSIQLNIELKTGIEIYPGIEKRVLELVNKSGMGERVLYSSFNHESLALLMQFDAKARVGLLYSNILVRPWEYANAVGAYAIHPGKNSLRTPNLIHHCHSHGVAVNVWTVNEPTIMRWCIQERADGIITNKPDVAYKQF